MDLPPRPAGDRPPAILARMVRGSVALLLASLALAPLGGQAAGGLTPKDLFALRSVGDVQVSPDGSRVAYAVVHNDTPGRPYAVVTILDLQTGRSHTLPRGSYGPRWAPDGRRLAFVGQGAEGAGLMVSEADGSGARFLAPIVDTNHPLPSAAESVAWSPDGRRIAFVSATPGPEGDDANGDPMVITRYLYKPTAGEGSTRFNDNRRTHLFVVDVGSRQVTPAHRGHRLRAFDRLVAGRRRDRVRLQPRGQPRSHLQLRRLQRVGAHRRQVRRITATKSAEYAPVWSPDGTRLAFAGTRRDLTSSETTMEDTHVWVMNADGSQRVEIGAGHRQPPGRAALVGRRTPRLLHAAGARRRAAGAAAGGRRRRSTWWSRTAAASARWGVGKTPASPTPSPRRSALGSLHARPRRAPRGPSAARR